MKSLLAACLVFSLAIISAGADEIQLPHITVYGTATTEVVPDEMVWLVEVRNKSLTPEAAAVDHGKTVQAVLSLLKASGVDEKTVQTSRMEFGINQEYTSGSWVKSGYYAKTDVSFKITDFAFYKKLWSGLAGIQGVSVQSVSYDHSKRIEYRNETRRKALQAAKDKAGDMAGVLGAEIGEPLLVEEDLSASEGWWGGLNLAENNLRTVTNEKPETPEQLSLGTIPIKARVKVSFHLLSAQR
jgi:uncharacterized protein YggE